METKEKHGNSVSFSKGLYDLIFWLYRYFCAALAKDRSGKPEAGMKGAVAGLGTDSLVAPRHAAIYSSQKFVCNLFFKIDS
ncbi:MAG: hypothetical protein ORN54_05900 [Cyclobacteriaceae bacterium]|nr:hypothetical protein [Cyclobacteriaceae bacterium]